MEFLDKRRRVGSNRFDFLILILLLAIIPILSPGAEQVAGSDFFMIRHRISNLLHPPLDLRDKNIADLFVGYHKIK